MRHHAFAAAIGLLTALLVPSTQSEAAGPDPTGIWMKQEASDYPAKMDIRKCGKGQLCCKIVWLQVLNDTRGKPLHDVRNEDPSRRDRPILGLPIFNNLIPAEPGVWTGDIYNPEDGHIYTDIKLTQVSRNQIVIRGCKAWLLCGEKIWTRSTLPAPPPPAAEPEQQEAKATPAPAPQAPAFETAAAPEEIKAPASPETQAAAEVPATPQPPAPMVEAVAEPVGPPPPMPTPKPARGAGGVVPAKAQIEASAAVVADATQSLPIARGAAHPEMLKPALPSPSQDASAGYGFMLTTASPESAPPFSSERVSSMFVITYPLGSATASNAPVSDVSVEPQLHAPDGSPVPLPEPKPKAKPKSTLAADATDPLAVAPKPKPKKPVKKPQEDLPWLQHP